MIDPIIFSFDIGSLTITLRWYGVLVMSGLLAGAYIADREITRRGGDAETLWDALLWIAPAGVVGARLWYVLNDILGGGSYFLDDPVRILLINQGGLHIYGAVVAGMIAAYIYLKREGMDFLLFLDSVAPAMLIGQAIGRFANYINQELYGPPTDLPWGIPISAEHRIPPWNDLSQFPESSTRFHPAFAYEIVWNLLGANLLIYISRRYEERVKPGVIFAGWLVWAGLGRFLLESFRPDQPRIPGTDISITRVVAGVMALIGVLVILAKYRKINIPMIAPGPEKYRR